MLTLPMRDQFLIGVLLTGLLIATRGQHFTFLQNLPSASWAVFFLAGVYLRPPPLLPALFVLVWAMDFIPYLAADAGAAEILRGGRAFCLTPAYFFLFPAYAALWWAGRWYAQRHRPAWSTLPLLAAALVSGAAVCQLFSSGGFYFFSGRFAQPGLAEFAARLVKYFPYYLLSMSFYVAFAAVTQAGFNLISAAATPDKGSGGR